MAVEMALLLPLLMLFLFGIIDFGRAFNVQMRLTEAARQGVRATALTSPSDRPVAAGTEMTMIALQGLKVEPLEIDPCSETSTRATVTVRHTFDGALFNFPIRGRAVMKCPV